MTTFTSIESLSTFLQLDSIQCKELVKKSSFPLLLPLRLAEKIEKGRLDDPILRQFVPLIDEKIDSPQFHSNPVGDKEASLTPKLLKKYKSRALVIASGSCAMHCRFCFRREFEYEIKGNFDQELELIQKDDSLKEVILSGGDPLSLSNRALEKMLNGLDAISHLKRVRFHTRFPLGFPERIDEGFLALLKRRVQIWFVIHCNHPKELDEEVLSALKKIPAPLLCQTVLLKGVNDDLATLKELCERLIDHGILPYYLHQLDRVRGASHFEVSEDRGRELTALLEKELSGYGVPRYVKEIAGQQSKTRLL